MRRSVQALVALLCVLAQGTFALSSAFELVYCVAQDHSGIELVSDDCCADETVGERAPATTLEDGCCSDVPLHVSGREVLSGRRPHHATAPILVLSSPWLPLTGQIADRLILLAAAPAATPLARRSVVLRV
jgi:hypothetical protein